MAVQSTKTGSPFAVRLAQISITSDGELVTANGILERIWSNYIPVTLNLVLFPADALLLAKDFWRECGMGISSRLANYALLLLSRKPVSSTHSGFNIASEFLQSSWEIEDSCFGSAAGKVAKHAICARISDLLRHGRAATPSDVTIDDVYLYPTGMCAI